MVTIRAREWSKNILFVRSRARWSHEGDQRARANGQQLYVISYYFIPSVLIFIFIHHLFLGGGGVIVLGMHALTSLHASLHGCATIPHKLYTRVHIMHMTLNLYRSNESSSAMMCFIYIKSTKIIIFFAPNDGRDCLQGRVMYSY